MDNFHETLIRSLAIPAVAAAAAATEEEDEGGDTSTAAKKSFSFIIIALIVRLGESRLIYLYQDAVLLLLVYPFSFLMINAIDGAWQTQ